MSLDSVPAEQAAMTIEEINQALKEILDKWQASVAEKDCPADVASQYYEQAAKLIEHKRLLESLQGKAGGVQLKAEAIVVAAQVAQEEHAKAVAAPAAEPTPAPVEAKANGSPPKKPTKKKATKVKVSLVMKPETVFAEAPSEHTDAQVPASDPSPAMPVIHGYSDAEALADGTLVDVSSLKVNIKGIPVTRMTTAVFARMDVAAKAFQKECEQVQVPFVLTVAWRNWIVSQIKQAVIKGDILQVPRTPTSGAIWIMENEGGGFTMLSPSDY
jgi:hypothetical protein